MRCKTLPILRRILRRWRAPTACFANLTASTENAACATRCNQDYYPSSQIWMMEHEFRDDSECYGETSYFRRGKKSRDLWERE
jgi:hypothetical protein